MTTETLTCPAEGCDYSGVRSSVLGHCSGKQDDAHNGGYEYWKKELEGDGDGGTSGESEASESDSGASDGGDPTMGDASPDEDTKDIEGRQGLPCGHEAFDPSNAPDPPFRVQCEQCGDSWVFKG